MKRQHSWFVALTALIVLLVTGTPHAAARQAQRASYDGRFFSGQGPAFYPFTLDGGKYSIDAHALYNSIFDADNAGDCLFGAYIDGVETPIHLTLSVPIPVSAEVPWIYNPTISLPAGHYKLVVLPGTDCDWSVSILLLGPAAPGIDVVEVDSFLHRGSTFTPTSEVHWGQTINFAIFYTLQGQVSGTPSGTLTLSQHGKSIVSFKLYAKKDTDGTQQLYINLIFPRALAEKEGFTTGSATASFSITVGTFHVRRSLNFTLAN